MTIWETGDPPIPNRVYVCFYGGDDGQGYYGLAVWTGRQWMPFKDENTDAPLAWMFVPDGPTRRRAGQPKRRPA